MNNLEQFKPNLTNDKHKESSPLQQESIQLLGSRTESRGQRGSEPSELVFDNKIWNNNSDKSLGKGALGAGSAAGASIGNEARDSRTTSEPAGKSQQFKDEVLRKQPTDADKNQVKIEKDKNNNSPKDKDKDGHKDKGGDKDKVGEASKSDNDDDDSIQADGDSRLDNITKTKPPAANEPRDGHEPRKTDCFGPRNPEKYDHQHDSDKSTKFYSQDKVNGKKHPNDVPKAWER